MDRGTWFRVWLPLVIGLWALITIFRSKLGPHDSLRWLGLVVALLGFSGIIVARYTLGRSFSIAPKARALVTWGIYARIRNPIYVSGIVLLAGVFLIIRNPHLWWLLLLAVIAQTMRARREARVLENKFGDAYREYRARTWF